MTCWLPFIARLRKRIYQYFKRQLCFDVTDASLTTNVNESFLFNNIIYAILPKCQNHGTNGILLLPQASPCFLHNQAVKQYLPLSPKQEPIFHCCPNYLVQPKNMFRVYLNNNSYSSLIWLLWKDNSWRGFGVSLESSNKNSIEKGASLLKAVVDIFITNKILIIGKRDFPLNKYDFGFLEH